MAVLSIYNPLIFSGGVGVVTTATATQITIVSGSVTQNYYGFGFTYSGASVIGGTVTDTNLFDANNGGWQYGITGLSHDAATVASYVNSGNQQGLITFLLSGNDTLNGSAGSDILNGYAGFNVILAGGGADTLYGGTGIDTLAGGIGDDVYVLLGLGLVSIFENPAEGADTIRSYFDNYTLPANVEALVIEGAATNGAGNDLDNLILGNSQNNSIAGGAGNDTLQGGQGADTLDGGEGADQFLGGDADNTYVIDNPLDVITDSNGNDTVIALINGYALADGLETLILADSVLTGGGNGGANTLIGGLGSSTLSGGAGDDTYVFDSSDDVAIESVSGGNDHVQNSASYALQVEVESLTLVGVAAISGTGNAANNFITGNSAANTLDGGVGVDTLSGGFGDDVYYVDDPADLIIDSEGIDGVVATFTFDLASAANIENVTLAGLLDINASGNALANVITGNAGRNVLVASGASDRLNGGDGEDTLVGTAFVDTLDGGAGADSMSGGAGGDFFFVDDAGDVIVDASLPLSGDTVLSLVSYTASASIGAVVLLGNASINATGSYSLTGNAGNNVLTGLDVTADTLSGLEGDDTLVGSLGGDVIQGSAGNDVYLVSSSGLTLIEGEGAGRDTIRSFVSEVTRLNFEVLVLLGTDNISGGGNELDNIISGNSGNNEIFGGVGNDIVAGGAGNDTYFVDSTGDMVMELADSGIDLVQSSVSYDLMMAWHVERLTLTGNVALSGSGNWLDNWIIGNSAGNVISGNFGNDTLDGAGGNDTLLGGAGNDLYRVDTVNDLIVEAVNSGIDTIMSASSYDLIAAANVEALVLMEGGNFNGSGNDLDNSLEGNFNGNVLNGRGGNDTLRGNYGNDYLSGGDGDDWLEGGELDDTLEGGSGADVLVGGANNDLYVIGAPGDIIVEMEGGGTDSIIGAQSISLSGISHVEVAVLDGTADVNATGSSGNDFLLGNAGNNTLAGMDGADVLDGLGGADILQGGSGNDMLRGGAGSDSLYGGDGDDSLIWDPADGVIRGDAGFDRLVLNFGGPQLNLEMLDDALIQNVEAIDMAAFTSSPGDLLRFSVTDILALSSTTDVLRIDGDSADAVVASVPDWVPGSTIVIGAQTYMVYTNGAATIQVDVDINRSGLVPGLPEIELAALDGSNGFVVHGVSVSDQSGNTSAMLGDINGDGFADMMIGARYADPAGHSSGAAYVVFGAAGGWAGSLQLGLVNGNNGIKLTGVSEEDQLGVSVSAAGDVNGDGFGDFLLGAFGADVLDIQRAGFGYLVFGGSAGFLDGLHGATGFEVSGVDGTNGIALHGTTPLMFAGRSVSGGGDVNGDGFDDLLIGAYGDAPNGSRSGAAYVVFGGSAAYLDALHGVSGLDLSTIDGANGLRLNGIAENDFAGRAVSIAGDINGDGYDDLLVSATGTDFNGSYSGSTYIVFGGNNAYIDTLHGSTGFNLSSLDGANGLRLSGRNALDFSGVSVSAAGDINGDGFADLIVGAPPAPNNQRFGESYVVFGAAGGFSANLDLSNLDGTNGFRVNGAQQGDGAGFSVRRAGDFNGDGFDDLIIGAYGTDHAGGFSGSAYVLFGQGSGFSAVLDLGTPVGMDVLRLDGLSSGDITGLSVAGGDDINGDGFDDIIIGAPGASPAGVATAGSTYIVFGQDYSELVDFAGGTGDDSLSGASGAERFVAGTGNDTVSGGGGEDVIRAGSGNDLIRIADTVFADIDGGSGQDGLVLDGSGLHLDLTVLHNSSLSGIEIIDLTGTGNNTLTLKASDLLDLSMQGNTLIVDGNVGDSVNLHGAWTNAGGTGYTSYVQSQATILIDTDITVAFI